MLKKKNNLRTIDTSVFMLSLISVFVVGFLGKIKTGFDAFTW